MLQEDTRLIDCQISKNSSISLMHRLWGGAEGKRGPSCSTSYKEEACPKGPQTADSPSSQPSPYLAEKMESTPTLEIKNSQVKQHFTTLQSIVVICHFNGFWPRSFELHQWIHTN